MKRMVLVPEDLFTRFEQKQKLETSPIVTSMIKTDEKMSNALERTDIDDAQKQKLYYANLERYLNLRHQKDSQIPTVQLKMKNSEKDESTGIASDEIVKLADSTIVDSVPKTMRQRATAILNRLKTRPDIVSWDESGQVNLDGKTIPNSNISDLLSDALRERKNFNPTGSKQFFRVLSKINMPKDLVRNDERWRQILDNSSSGDEETLYTTPRAGNTSKFLSTPKRHLNTIKSKLNNKPSWYNY